MDVVDAMVVPLAVLVSGIGIGILLWSRRSVTAVDPHTPLRSLSDCSFSVDEDGQILAVEASPQQLDRFTDLVLRPLRDVIHPDDREALHAAWEARGPDACRPITLRLCGSGQTWFEGTLVFVAEPAPQPTSAFFRCTGTHDESASRESGFVPVVHAVAHQLNNRLHLIRGFSEIAHESPAPASETRAAGSQIGDAIEESAELLRRLVELTSNPSAETVPVSVNEVLHQVRNFAGPILGSRFEIIIEPSREPLVARANPVALRHALTILVIGLTDDPRRLGDISMRSEKTDTDEIVLEIRSAGDANDAVGMHQPALSFATARVASFEGRIEYDSAPDGAGRLRVFLADASSTAPQADRSSGALEISHPPDHSSRTVLIVDPSEQDRAAIRSALRQDGHRILEAETGDDAYEEATRSGPVDVLIIERLLARETGSEVRERVARACPGIQTVYVTAYPSILGHPGESDDIALSKPIDSKQLRERVSHSLERS